MAAKEPSQRSNEFNMKKKEPIKKKAGQGGEVGEGQVSPC